MKARNKSLIHNKSIVRTTTYLMLIMTADTSEWHNQHSHSQEKSIASNQHQVAAKKPTKKLFQQQNQPVDKAQAHKPPLDNRRARCR